MWSCYETLSSPSLPVVVCIFMSASGHVGILKTVGFFMSDINIDLETTATDMGRALGLLNAFFLLPGPITAALYRNHSIRRPLLISGTCLQTLGVAFFSMATSKAQMTIFLSMTGLGIGTVILCCILTLHHVARGNFNLCIGLGLSGYGAGMVLLPIVAEFLRNPYGWRGGLLIISALIAHTIPCSMGIRMKSDEESRPTQKNGFQPIESSSTGPLEMDITEENEANAGHGSGLSNGNCRFWHVASFRGIANILRESDFYKDPVFTLIFGVEFAFDMVYSGWHSFLVPHVLQRGISVEKTIILTLSGAVGNTLSRCGVGVITNHQFKPIDVYIFATTLNIGALLVDVLVVNYYVMLVTSCFSAMSIGGRAAVTTLIERERASPDKFDVVFSLARCFSGGAMFLGGYLGGLVADTFSSFNATFTMLPIIEAVVLILVVVMKCYPKPDTL
ncbi:monocarboxylate transporter 2-like [Lytechinus variegatus]|uniref:monocarboxylate transporter 2-like n=1 Tax=Lytechinus variegatus TaxID=7654 RepID=UPI001BB22CDD|nr:monocarboxylate transporter 2-like [Lytechinus variegatus]